MGIMPYNNTVRVKENNCMLSTKSKMIYSLYNEEHELLGQFSSIYAMQIYVHDLRVERDEWRVRKNQDISVFDYIKEIGYTWDCVPSSQVGEC